MYLSLFIWSIKYNFNLNNIWVVQLFSLMSSSSTATPDRPINGTLVQGWLLGTMVANLHLRTVYGHRTIHPVVIHWWCCMYMILYRPVESSTTTLTTLLHKIMCCVSTANCDTGIISFATNILFGHQPPWCLDSQIYFLDIRKRFRLVRDFQTWILTTFTFTCIFCMKHLQWSI